MTCAPVPTVSWMSPGSAIPLPRAAAAVSPLGRDREARGQPELGRGRGGEMAGGRARGRQQGRQQAGVQAQRRHDLKVPAITHQVVQQGGGGITGLGPELTGQPGPDPVFWGQAQRVSR